MTRRTRKSGDGCGSLVVIALIVIAGIAISNIWNSARESALKPFAGHLYQFTSISGLHQSTTRAYIAGNVIPIDKKANEIDSIYFDLPKDLRASTPEEVSTVVWLTCNRKSVGFYSDGASAYQITCDVEIIDIDEAAIVASRSFVGSEPPETKSGSGSRAGSDPTKDIVEYITSLPRH